MLANNCVLVPVFMCAWYVGVCSCLVPVWLCAQKLCEDSVEVVLEGKERKTLPPSPGAGTLKSTEVYKNCWSRVSTQTWDQKPPCWLQLCLPEIPATANDATLAKDLNHYLPSFPKRATPHLANPPRLAHGPAKPQEWSTCQPVKPERMPCPLWC